MRFHANKSLKNCVGLLRKVGGEEGDLGVNFPMEVVGSGGRVLLSPFVWL